MSSNTESKAENIALRESGLQNLHAGHHKTALEFFKKALELDQRDSLSWSGLGSALEELNDPENAQTAYGNALTSDPKSFAAAHHLGRLLIRQGKAVQAVDYLTRALEINPASTGARSDLGAAFMELNNFTAAEENYRQAIALRPSFLPAHINLGKCLREQHKHEDAVALFRSALGLDAHYDEAAIGLALTLSDLGQTDEAIHVLDTFLSSHGEHIESHQNKALILLRAGRLAEGFEEYAWRLYPTKLGVPRRPFTAPTWQGDDLGDRKLLVWLEQGVGDEIMALGLWDTLFHSDKAPQIILECDQRLVRLAARSFPNIRVVERQDPAVVETKNAHVACPAWSAAPFLRSDFSLFPDRPQYLVAEPAAVASLRERYEGLAQGKTIVGLSWSSRGRSGRQKTPPLETWASLLKDNSLFFVSLQYAPPDGDIDQLADLAGRPIYVDPHVDIAHDIDMNAAQISALDGVVTISNSTAHLAGALGVPVATLVPNSYGGFWYWFRERTDSPWYPSMKLCRQNRPGDWLSAVSAAQRWLQASD